jgi:RNA polymerase-binding transcription factor DksA
MTTTPADTSRPPFVNVEDEDLVRLRAALVAEREAQTALVMNNQATVGALTGQRDVDSILEREMAEGAAARAQDAVEAIDDALGKMTTGTYGLCESCRSPIPLARLEAIPGTRSCIACSDRQLAPESSERG